MGRPRFWCASPCVSRTRSSWRRHLFPVRAVAPWRISMVINCVPTARGRYDMLRGYRNHLRDGGHLFLMLPLLCLTKSTRTTRESFLETLAQLGFAVVAQKESPKVAFFCFTTAEPRSQESSSQQASKQAGSTGAGGKARRRNRGGNDFAIGYPWVFINVPDFCAVHHAIWPR